MRLHAFVSKPSLQGSLAEKERSPGKRLKIEHIIAKQKTIFTHKKSIDSFKTEKNRKNGSSRDSFRNPSGRAREETELLDILSAGTVASIQRETMSFLKESFT